MCFERESFALFSTDNRLEISVSVTLLLQNLPLFICPLRLTHKPIPYKDSKHMCQSNQSTQINTFVSIVLCSLFCSIDSIVSVFKTASCQILMKE